MRAKAPPDCDSTWLPDFSAGPTRPSAGDHKILCQGCEIISVGRCCQGFPYGKITSINHLIFQYIMNFISGSFRPEGRLDPVEPVFPRSTTYGMQKNRTKYAQFVHRRVRTRENQGSRAPELVRLWPGLKSRPTEVAFDEKTFRGGAGWRRARPFRPGFRAIRAALLRAGDQACLARGGQHRGTRHGRRPAQSLLRRPGVPPLLRPAAGRAAA